MPMGCASFFGYGGGLQANYTWETALLKAKQTFQPKLYTQQFKRKERKTLFSLRMKYGKCLSEPAEDKTVYKVFQGPSIESAMTCSWHCYPGKAEHSVLDRAVFKDTGW